MDDLDYLFSTARIRAMETKLLNRERLLRMINAKSMEEAIRVLMECGWEESVDFSTYEAMERSLYTELALFCSVLYRNNIYISFTDRVYCICSAVKCNKCDMSVFSHFCIFAKLL